MTHAQQMQQKGADFRVHMDRFIATLERLSDEAATRPPADGGWTRAQIGWHIAVTNDLLAGAIAGRVPFAQPISAEFREDPQLFTRIPAKVETFPQLQPPSDASRTAAVDRLRASVSGVVGAFEALTEERAKGHMVPMKFGSMSMYQFADFTIGHVARHQAQLDRAVSQA